MNQLRIILVNSNKRLWVFLVVCGALLLILRVMSTSGRTQSSSQLQEKKRINGKVVTDKEPPEQRTSIIENGPSGRWSGAFVPDLERNSANSPVVLTATRTLMGNSQLRNLQLTHVTLKNYSHKTVLGLQFKWFVTTAAERSKLVAPAQYTGLVEAYLLPGEMKQVESPVIVFSNAVQSLVKSGNLEGQYVVQVMTYQVEFEDGSSWNADWGGPKPGDRGQAWQGPLTTTRLRTKIKNRGRNDATPALQ